jgi:hypothetical protein
MIGVGVCLEQTLNEHCAAVKSGAQERWKTISTCAVVGGRRKPIIEQEGVESGAFVALTSSEWCSRIKEGLPERVALADAELVLL